MTETSDSVIVTEFNRLRRVDLATGNRTIVSGCLESQLCNEMEVVGSGPFLLSPSVIALENSDSAMVISEDFRAVIRVNLVTGERTFFTRSLRRE